MAASRGGVGGGQAGGVHCQPVQGGAEADQPQGKEVLAGLVMVWTTYPF